MALVKVKKTLQIDSADRDTTKYPTNGDYVVYLPRIYKNVTSLRLKGAEFPNVGSISVRYPSFLSSLTDTAYLTFNNVTGSGYNNSGYPLYLSVSFNSDNAYISNSFGSLSTAASSVIAFTIPTTIKSIEVPANFACYIKIQNIFVNYGFIFNKTGDASGTLRVGVNSLLDTFNPGDIFIMTVCSPSGISHNQLIASYYKFSSNIITPYSSDITNLNVIYDNNSYQVYLQTPTISSPFKLQNVYLYTPNVLGNAPNLYIQSPFKYIDVYNGFSHSILYGENNNAINIANDTNLPSNLYYFLLELEGLNKTDEARVGGDKSSFVDKYFAKIPMLVNNTTNIIEYNDKNLQENIATYSPPIEELNRLHIKTRTHAQQDGSGFIYWSPYTTVTTFNINSISNLTIWLDSSDTTTLFQDQAGTNLVTTYDGTQNVLCWKDKSGNAYNAIKSTNQGTPPPGTGGGITSPVINKTTGSWSNNPFLQFITTDELQVTAKFPNQSRSIFVVYQVPSGFTGYSSNGLAFLNGFNVGQQGVTLNAVGSPPALGANSVENKVLTNSGSYKNTNIQMISVVNSNTSADNNIFAFNGTPQTLSTSITASSYSTTLGTYQIGVSINHYMTNGNYTIISYGTPFNVGEIIEYNSELSTLDRQKVEGYLAWKWGFQTSLPSNHPYASKIPSNSTTTANSEYNLTFEIECMENQLNANVGQN